MNMPVRLLALAGTLWIGVAGEVTMANTTRPAADPAKRAASLARKMTRSEKLQYVHGYFPPYQKPRPPKMANAAGDVPGIARLGIPDLRESDASLGVANNVEQRPGDTATALPGTLALAASFDPALARSAGAMIGSEARAKTFNVLLAGGVNLTRDAWGGRNFEYFGEDPLLSGVMAGAAVAGVQSNHIIATVKHFALNAQETGRDVLDAQLDHDALQESDLLAFRIAIEDGQPGSVMCAYNKVDGVYACENRWLLTDVLRRDWRYPGFVMSDWGAVHSTAQAALAGLDQESGQELDDRIYFGAPLAEAVDTGRVPERRLDEMVTRILTAVIASGLYDDPVPATLQPIDFAADAAVAQRVAERGMVLLKNAGATLPLARTAKRIVLIGGHADVGVLSGGGSSQVRSVGGVPVEVPLTEGTAMSFARVTWHASSPLRALQAALPGVTIDYLDGHDPVAAAAAAARSDVAIVFATQWRTEAQDLPSLALPDGQDALIGAVAKANRATVVVAESGGAVLMPWLDQVAAVVAAWYPGQRGGEALARLLVGDSDFAGRLPLTFPRSASQLPRAQPADPARPIAYPERGNAGYRWFAQRGETPLFPFGYGLSYAGVTYHDVHFTGGARPQASVVVRNSDTRATTAVPQLYLVGPERAPARLVGWLSADLAPGEVRRITIAADRRLLARHGGGRWSVAPGPYRLTLCLDADHAIASGKVRIRDIRRPAPDAHH
jgi:beta-glucosidase